MHQPSLSSLCTNKTLRVPAVPPMRELPDQVEGRKMEVTIREAKDGDAAICGRICYEAFKAIATEHNFPPDFPNAEAAIGVLSMMLANG
jgi:hypothetical protein